jgi:DNA (cytosine-5)-methyltransferase 1
MSQLRALDLYCKAGGATRGLQQAGFHVTGVDLVTSPRYCGDEFQPNNVLNLIPGWIRAKFDFVWASPPCQFATALKHMHNAKPHENLIHWTRDLLFASGVPYVIENVEGAREHLRNPITLCGSMFGLGAQGCRLERHRLFEASFPLVAPPCRHDDRPVIGIYGGHARRRAASAGGRGTRDAWEGGHRAAASEALGIDWATLGEMSEAIPPAYSHWIAQQWLAYRLDSSVAIIATESPK